MSEESRSGNALLYTASGSPPQVQSLVPRMDGTLDLGDESWWLRTLEFVRDAKRIPTGFLSTRAGPGTSHSSL